MLNEGYFLVGVDRKNGCIRLAEFLKTLGHRSVLCPDGGTPYLREGFASAGLEVLIPPSLPPGGSSFEERGRLSARACMPLIKKGAATALCYGDDAVAGFALSELSERGVSVPGNVTVTGFDGLEIASAFHPRLTTLKVPVLKMVDCVRDIIDGKEKRNKRIFRMELLEGRSHGKAKSRQYKHGRPKSS